MRTMASMRVPPFFGEREYYYFGDWQKKLALQKRPFDQETATTAKICAEAFDEGKNLQTLQKSWPGLSASLSISENWRTVCSRLFFVHGKSAKPLRLKFNLVCTV